MSESEYYAHECMRAELLGLPKPDKDSLPPRPVASEEDEIESDMAEADQVKAPVEEGAELQDEQRAQGGMDGVHNILSITQKKLNNIKCGIGNVGSSFSSSLSGGLSGLSGLSGSLSGFIKQRVGGGEGGPSGGEIPEAADETMESSGAPSTAIDRQMLK